MKNCLITDPVLKPFDSNKDIVIFCDAAKTGIGFCLLQQGDDNKLHVVSYGSRALLPAQSRYTVDELEMMGLALALRQYEVLAIHRQITVLTDNVHLLHLDKWHPINNRQRRLVAYLLQFRLAIKYVKGAFNYTADALSRLYQDLPESERTAAVPEPTQDDFIVAITPSSDVDNQGAKQSTVATHSNTTPDVTVDALVSDGQNDNLLPLPTLTENDYLEDTEFQYLFTYLKDGELSGDDKIDRLTLLVHDQYTLEDNLLFKLPIARNKKQIHTTATSQRLCVPRKFRHELLKYFHENFGHFGINRLFLTLSTRVYWKSLFQDIKDFCTSCDNCLRSKRNYTRKLAPLHPLEVPDRPFQIWHLDHKVLTRKTNKGNIGILCIIDAFSNYPILRAVPDFTAFTTAKIFVEEVVSKFGFMEVLITDKGAAFVGQFFTHLTKLLNITHRTSAARTPRTNGLAEQLVQKVSQMLKQYAPDDLHLEDSLPLIEMSLRAWAHTRLGLTPFEILYAQPMRIAAPLEVRNPLPSTGDAFIYYKWLKEQLQNIHQAVKARKIDIKKEDKSQYDIRHSVKTPTWSIGDLVLLENKKYPLIQTKY